MANSFSSVTERGINAIASGPDVDSLRRALVTTVIGHYLAKNHNRDESCTETCSVLESLLGRLPTQPLAAVAKISKGRTGIKDALPGRYPLVVTAEQRSQTDHFDFDEPGVMIPLVSSTGHGDASIKRIHYQEGQYAVGTILAVVQPKDSSILSARYLHAYLSTFKDDLLVSRMVGTANVSLTVAKLSDVPIPMLPIDGQQQVSKLMALCDRLEAEQADAAEAHARLVDALLATLTASRDAHETAANWQRLSEHFDTLFTNEASITALKQTILQLAVMGRLVPQDPTDEPASELLKRIEAEKARLVKEGKIRKPKVVEPVGEDERPFEIPAGWEWARLGNVGMIGSSSRVHQKDWTTSGIPFYRAREIVKLSRDGYVDNDLFISPELHQSLSSGGNCPEPNDLMITGVGTIGIPYVVQQNDRFYFKDASVLIFKNLFHLPTDYLRLFCLSPYWIKVIHDSSMGTTVHTLTIVRANEVAVPLPPLPEQHRIVAKVDELMALCDRLQADLATARNHRSRLADTLVQAALEAA